MPRKLLLSIFLIIVFLSFSHSVFALELNYPNIGGYVINANSGLVDYVQYFFVFAVFVSGGIAVMSIVISGAQILLFAGSPWAVSEARERIFGSILGIILLLSAMIILRTINPELTKLQDIKLGLNDGVYLSNLSKNINIPIPEGQIVAAPDPSFQNLYLQCSNTKTIMFWVFDAQESKTYDLTCEKKGTYYPITNTNKSFLWSYLDAGVYYYQEENCQGIASCNSVEGRGNSCSQKISGPIPINFFNKPVRSMRIVSRGLAPEFYPQIQYGVVLTKNFYTVGTSATPYGECSFPRINLSPGISCLPAPLVDADGLPFDPRYAYVLKVDPFHGKSNNIPAVTIRSKKLNFTFSEAMAGDEYICSSNERYNCPGNNCTISGRSCNNCTISNDSVSFCGTPDNLLDKRGEPYGSGGTSSSSSSTTRPDECGLPWEQKKCADPSKGDHCPCTRYVVPLKDYYTIIYTADEDLEGYAQDRECRVFWGKSIDLQNDTDILGVKKLYRFIEDMVIIPHFPGT